jgi:hypothetical protein
LTIVTKQVIIHKKDDAVMSEKEVILTAVSDPAQLELLRKQLGKEGYES